MTKLVTGYYLVNNTVLVLEQNSIPTAANYKMIRVAIDSEVIKQWNEELMLGITDDWEED